MAGLMILLLPLLLTHLTESLVITTNSTFQNYDFRNKQYSNYSEVGEVVLIKFIETAPCHVASINSSLLLSPAIPVILWDVASFFGCQTFTDVIVQVVAQSPSNFPVIIFTSTYADFDHFYGWQQQEGEPYGEDLWVNTPQYLTLVSNNTGYLLAENFQGKKITVTMDRTAIEQFFHTPGWIGLNWFLFTAWLFSFLYAIIQLFFYFYDKRKFIYNFRVLVFISGSLAALCRMIECAADPYQSTGKLLYYPHQFVWWLTYGFAIIAFFAILSAWTTVVSSVSKFSSLTGLIISRTLAILSALVFICVIIIAAVSGIVSDIVYGLLFVLVILTGIFFLVCGIRILSLLYFIKTEVGSNSNQEKNDLIRRCTYIVVLAVINFCGLIATMIYIGYTNLFLGPEIQSDPSYIVGVRLALDITLYLMLSGLFISLRFQGFSHVYTTTAKSDHHMSHISHQGDFPKRDSREILA